MSRKPWSGRIAEAAPRPVAPPADLRYQQAPKSGLPAYSMNSPEAAAYVGVSAKHMNNLVRSGAVPSFKLGERVLVRRVDLERIADSQCENGFTFRQPETVTECRIAAENAAILSVELERQAKKTADPEVADFLYLASRAYNRLALFFRWNGGIGEFSPDALADVLAS